MADLNAADGDPLPGPSITISTTESTVLSDTCNLSNALIWILKPSNVYDTYITGLETTGIRHVALVFSREVSERNSIQITRLAQFVLGARDGMTLAIRLYRGAAMQSSYALVLMSLHVLTPEERRKTRIWHDTRTDLNATDMWATLVDNHGKDYLDRGYTLAGSCHRNACVLTRHGLLANQ